MGLFGNSILWKMDKGMDDMLIMNKSKGRMHYIDVAKGIGIILVVIGHLCPSGTWDVMPITNISLTKWIYSFHMPLFYVISGYTGKKRILKHPKDFCKWIEKIIVNYFVPYMLMMLVLDGFSCKKLKDYLLPRQEVLVGYSAIASWWLPSLIVVVVIVQIIDQFEDYFGKSNYIWAVGCALCMVAGMFLDGTNVGNQVWYWNIALVGVGFYGIGRGLKSVILNRDLEQWIIPRATLCGGGYF